MTYNIKALRSNRNMTQQDLADMLGVSKVTISNYEKGAVPSNSAKMLKYSLAYIFQVDIDDIRL